MKFHYLIISMSLMSLNSMAQTNCTQEIKTFLSSVAPTSGKVLVTGQYTNKSKKTGDFKACQLSISAVENRLELDFTPAMFNPSFGDGGAFWPFGSYPTIEQASDQYRTLNYFHCSANQDGFQIDYSYTNRTGWNETKRYSVSLLKTQNGVYDAELRDGDPRLKAVTCRGTISEK